MQERNLIDPKTGKRFYTRKKVGSHRSERLVIMCSKREREAMMAAALEAEFTFSEWARNVLLQVAGHGLQVKMTRS
jgi:hypothetical protein